MYSTSRVSIKEMWTIVVPSDGKVDTVDGVLDNDSLITRIVKGYRMEDPHPNNTC